MQKMHESKSNRNDLQFLFENFFKKKNKQSLKFFLNVDHTAMFVCVLTNQYTKQLNRKIYSKVC